MVLLFDIDPEKALKRKLLIDGGDRLENESISFHQSVYKGYKTLIEYYPDIKVINAERSVEEIFEDVKQIINSI